MGEFKAALRLTPGLGEQRDGKRPDRDGARFTLCTTVRSLHLAETGHGGVRVPCVRFAWPLHLADNRVTTRAPVWVWTLALAFELVLVPTDYMLLPLR